MSITLKNTRKLKDTLDTVVLLQDHDDAPAYCHNEQEQTYVQKKLAQQEIVTLNQYERLIYFIKPIADKEGTALRDAYRSKGFELFNLIKQEKLTALQVTGSESLGEAVLDFCEGFLLSSYDFNKYKKQESKKKDTAFTLTVSHPEIKKKQVTALNNVLEGTFLARDLVNEPVISLNAEKLSKAFKKAGKAAGFSVDVYNKAKIKSLKMGGLLSVNAGSEDPPTFTVMEYKPNKPINDQPYVLVGKGVTYDTGGLSLKPSTSMDTMKSDMGGSAAVIGTMVAVAKNELPIHLIGLVPATDNRPSGNAIVPGDVITISDGTTVEVLNTDAEGRLILADALSFAKQYKPALVIDLATLTGAAAVALGKEGVVMMGTADDTYKDALKAAGNETHERLVEFPLWDEYQGYLKSDIADLKNIGGRMAGAITAGMFLKHFTDYAWIHLDIAGMAFLDAPDSYRGKNGTGVGVRLLYRFFQDLAQTP